MKSFMCDEDSEDLQTRKAIVIGSVGSGKTSLSRYVTGLYDECYESQMSGHSVTKGVHTYKGKFLKITKSDDMKIQFTLTDSEGYGADNFSSDNLKNQLLNSLQFETELNCVIIVVSFERFRNGLKEDLNHLLDLIKTLGLAKEHTLLCFTHGELYTSAVRNNYYEEFKKYYAFDIDLDNVIFGCFPNISEVSDSYKASFVRDLKASIDQLRLKLKEKNKSINAAMKLNELKL